MTSKIKAHLQHLFAPLFAKKKREPAQVARNAVSPTNAAPNFEFKPRPLPRQTQENLAKWGLTEANWVSWTSTDFAHFQLPKQDLLEAAAKTGDDAVALVLLALRSQTFSTGASVFGEGPRVPPSRSGDAGLSPAAPPSAAKADALPDTPENTDYLSRAVQMGDPLAQMLRARMLLAAGTPLDLHQGRTLYRLAAEGGLVDAMTDLSVALGIGQWFQEDRLLATTWARRSANLGRISGMRILALSLEEGWVGIKKPSEAMAWLQKAANLGDTDAMIQIAESYWYGIGADQSDQIALTWFGRAAEAGEPMGMVAMADALSAGRGVAKDQVGAVDWYRRAAEQGNGHGMVGLGLALLNGNAIEKNAAAAKEWFKRAAEDNNAIGMYLYATLLNTGIDGMDVNKQGAASWYARAINSGELSSESLAMVCGLLDDLEANGYVPAIKQTKSWGKRYI